VIQLPDGSRTILNTASAIAIDFKDGRRQVKLLDGEAYFDVVADAQRPFVVAGPLSTVEVKGTAFSVRAANAEDTVFLERGTVDVSRSLARSEQIRLTPGKTISTTSASLGTVRDADMKLALAWLDGRIIFQNQPFAAALKDLSRYFNGRVVVAPMRTPSIAVSGNYRLDDPETAIRTLAATVGLSATSVPGGILMLY
jgi:transmembrane sensor